MTGAERFKRDEAAAEAGPAAVVSRAVRGAKWPAAFIVAAFLLVWYVPPVVKAADVPVPARAEPPPILVLPVPRAEFDALKQSVEEIKVSVRDVGQRVDRVLERLPAR